MGEVPGPGPEEMGEGDFGDEDNDNGEGEVSLEKEKRKQIRKEIVAGISEILREQGFERTSSTWHRNNNGTIDVFYLQTAKFNFGYYLEAGVYDITDNSDNIKPKIEDCGPDKRERFGDQEGLLDFRDEDVVPEDQIELMKRLIVSAVLPYYEQKKEHAEDVGEKEIKSGPEKKSSVDLFLEDKIEDYVQEYAQGESDLDYKVDSDNVDQLISEMREANVDGLDDIPKDRILEKLQDARERAKAEFIENDMTTEEIKARGERIRSSQEEEISESEELSIEEKTKRAEEISIDAIPTAEDPVLKTQSDAGRAEFVVRIIAEFDQRGWTLPENLIQVSSCSRKNTTEHTKEKYKFIRSLAREIKDELMPDFM